MENILTTPEFLIIFTLAVVFFSIYKFQRQDRDKACGTVKNIQCKVLESVEKPRQESAPSHFLSVESKEHNIKGFVGVDSKTYLRTDVGDYVNVEIIIGGNTGKVYFEKVLTPSKKTA